MRIKRSDLKKVLNAFITEAIQEIENESVNRLRRANDGCGETNFEEDTDRLRRSDRGYGESDFEEDIDRLRRSERGHGETDFEEAATTGPQDPNSKAQQPSAASSAALHTRDKSQMQGVGPKRDMSNAFEPIGQKKEAATNFDPNVTVPLSPESPNAIAQTQRKSEKQAQIKQITQSQQKEMEKQGWKFQRQSDGNWSALPPPKSGGSMPKQESADSAIEKKEKFIKANKDSFKRRYGARGLEVLYATANEKFSKSK